MTGPREPLVHELRRYLRFGAAEEARVASLRPLVAPHLASIADAFYERIREHEDAHAVLRDEAQIARLRASLERWLASLFAGALDDAHFESTARIGRVHVAVGLPQRYMPSAAALIRSALTRIVLASGAPDAAESACALALLLDLELAVMMEAYKEHYVERLRALNEHELRARDSTLADIERRYVQAVELASVLIVGTDAGGRIVLFNREAERTTGWARDEAMGEDVVTLLFAPELRDEIRERLMGPERAPNDASFEAPLSTRAGNLRDVRWQLVHAPRGDGSATGLEHFLLGRDVTDELALAERTRQAERLAAVGTLAAGLAHEIRNPLHGAHLHVAFLERALRRAGAPADTRDAVLTVGAEIQRLSALVTEFLQFARPQPLSRRATLLSDAAERAIAVLRPEAERRSVQLDATLPHALPNVLGDGDKLEQVALNLVRNALEAFPPGRPGRVHVRVHREPRRVVLEVEDDGPGLASLEAPIFDAFYSTKPGGTGLGLPIAHRIVTDHGGTITVESAPGRTVFRVSLPLASSSYAPTPA